VIRKIAGRTPVIGLLTVVAGVCVAQTYPAKPVRFISPYPPGGSNDVVARMIAQRMSQVIGQQWIVENRPGRGGNIGAELVAKSPPDGYTLVHGGMGSLTLAPFLSKLPYDALRDFAPITLTARAPNVIAVHPSLPAKSVAELIALARERPGELNYGTSGVGSTPHLTAALLQSLARVQMVHIPYKGSTPATIDLVAGQIPILIVPISVLLPQIEAGKVRALGVSSAKRSPMLPAVPTIHEAGMTGFEMNPWFAIMAAAGTPRDIVARLNTAVTRYLRTPEAAKQFAAQGADVAFSSPDELLALMKSDLLQWGKVIRDNNIQGE
jgi:tripartite-type tricarboxylate transporter receptor subunit TctC